MKKITVVFAGGGTGGHIYPGLAVADELREIAKENQIEINIVWLGNSSGMDRSLVEKSGSVDRFYGIPSGKLRRYFSLKNFADLFKIGAGVIVSFFRLLSLRPLVLFSKGGFVSVTPCLAAKILKIPVFTHECDFTPGLATKINSRFAKKILVSYQETQGYLPAALKSKVTVTGNPVRPVFYSADSKRGFQFLFSSESKPGSKPLLLVLGGSLGAHQINELVVENLDWLCERFTVVHQCGAKDEDFVCSKKRTGFYPYAFIYKEMPDVLAASDIVLSRAGANSIWESSVSGKPMVLIPLCGSGTRGDQVDNAEYFERQGAAKVLVAENADSEHLKAALEYFIDEEKRAEAAGASKAMSEGKKPARKIAEIIFEEIV